MKLLRRLLTIDTAKMSPFDRQVIASMNMDVENWGLHPIAAHHDGLGMFVWKPFRGWQREHPRGQFPQRDFRMLTWRGKIAFSRKHADMLVSELQTEDGPKVDPNAGMQMNVQIQAPQQAQAVPMTAHEMQMRQMQQATFLGQMQAQQAQLNQSLQAQLQDITAKYNGASTLHGITLKDLVDVHGFSNGDVGAAIKASHGYDSPHGANVLGKIADIACK